MPNPSKPSRVLSINGQDYLVADSVKNELLLQVLELFSAQLVTRIEQRHVYDRERSEDLFVNYSEDIKAALSVSRGELVSSVEYLDRSRAAEVRRAAQDKAREEAAKNAK